MNILLNILWLIFGGFSAACMWLLATVILVLSLIGIPWARATFNIALLTLWPFGSKVSLRSNPKSFDPGRGFLGLIGNIFWLIFIGWWLFLYHLILAFVLGITIIGIPFAIQHWKLAMLSVFPIGKKIDNDLFD